MSNARYDKYSWLERIKGTLVHSKTWTKLKWKGGGCEVMAKKSVT